MSRVLPRDNMEEQLHFEEEAVFSCNFSAFPFFHVVLLFEIPSNFAINSSESTSKPPNDWLVATSRFERSTKKENPCLNPFLRRTSWRGVVMTLRQMHFVTVTCYERLYNLKFRGRYAAVLRSAPTDPVPEQMPVSSLGQQRRHSSRWL